MRPRASYVFSLLVSASCAFGCGSSDDSAGPVGPPYTPPGTDAAGSGGSAGAPGDAAPDTPLFPDTQGDKTSEASDAPPDTPGTTCTPDADGDNIPDEVEGKSENRDSDGDGTPDYLDLDSDGDTIPDRLEGDTVDVGCLTPLDSDGDKTPDYVDKDSDNNGVLDRDEIYPDGAAYDPARPAPNPADSDGDKKPDYVDKDNDGDQLDDVTELGGKAPVDTDGDGLPDFDDPDSDGDTIMDGYDGVTDFDKDGTPNFRDTDSDADTLPDSCEAGLGHKLWDLPVDSDKDGKYDFVDVDSDNDGLLDSQEDANHNCAVDAGETDPRLADTDGDGADDLIEITLGSNPNDPLESPETLGKFYFKIPYQQDPTPDKHTLAIKTTLSKADVGFVVDTTGTMAGEINNLKGGMLVVINQLLKSVPQLAVGVSAFDDFPFDPYGDGALSDKPFYLPSPAGKVSTAAADSQAAVNQLTIHGGGDDPESQAIAMWLALTNGQLQWPGQFWPPSQIPAGRFGALAFRNDALPIVLLVTDAAFHNGRRVTSPGTMHDAYSFNQVSNTPTIDDVVAAMADKGARFIGFASDNGVRAGDPYEDLAYLSDQTGSNVPPSAFGVANHCMTGIGGTAIPAPDGPGDTCRLVFDGYHNGDGLSEQVVKGVEAFLKGLVLDMRVVAVSDPPEAPLFVDSVDEFVTSVTVSQNGGNDPTDPGVPCVTVVGAKLADKWKGPKGLVSGPDTYNETVLQVTPTTKICFTVTPKINSTVPQTTVAQVFHAVLQVKARRSAKDEINVGQPRDVMFVVPPKPQ